MGRFDKILKEVGDKVPDLKLDELAKNVSDAVDVLKTEAEKAAAEIKDKADEAGIDLNELKEAVKESAKEAEAEVKAPAGSSSWWGGEEIPAEENLFNFNGTFAQYFEKIYAEDFPEYRVEKEAGWGGYDYSTIYTFYEGDRKVLVNEIVPNSSEARKLREKCRKEGIPYLRYYRDHEGWWNCRSYVVERTRKALKG